MSAFVPVPLMTSFGGFVADDAGGQHDVARPAAGAAEACEDPVVAGPVFGGQPLPAIGQRQRRRACRAVPRRVPAAATAVTPPRPSGSRAP